MNFISDKGLNLAMLDAMSRRPPTFERTGARFWDDPYIATQMLKAHLDPNTDAASRKPEIIAQTVAWLTNRLNLQAGTDLLDLGCGPGLYTRCFAARGLAVTGVDYSENSIRYAREHDPESAYIHADYLNLDFENQFDVVTLIYGDVCVLNDAARDTVLGHVHRALRPGGYFVFDVTTPVRMAHETKTWSVASKGGFWKPTPHIVLEETLFYREGNIELNRYIVMEASGVVTEYRVWTRHYSLETLQPILEKSGFKLEAYYSDLMGNLYQPTSEWLGIIARQV